MADRSNHHNRRPKHEAEDGQRRIFYGHPKFDRLFIATYDKKNRTWQRDSDL